MNMNMNMNYLGTGKKRNKNDSMKLLMSFNVSPSVLSFYFSCTKIQAKSQGALYQRTEKKGK